LESLLLQIGRIRINDFTRRNVEEHVQDLPKGVDGDTGEIERERGCDLVENNDMGLVAADGLINGLRQGVGMRSRSPSPERRSGKFQIRQKTARQARWTGYSKVMSLSEIVEELPRLSLRERRTLVRTLIDLEPDRDDLAMCDNLAAEAMELLDQMEANDADHRS
jgi:hypothetical protein